MTLQEWGALGELVGGVAVIATLLYLAVQTRQSRVVKLFIGQIRARMTGGAIGLAAKEQQPALGFCGKCLAVAQQIAVVRRVARLNPSLSATRLVTAPSGPGSQSPLEFSPVSRKFHP